MDIHERAKPPATLQVVDGLSDADGNNHYEIRGPRGSCWISYEQLHKDPRRAHSRIARETGIPLLLTRSTNQLRQSIEEFGDVRKGVVANYPGWTGESFVSGDGAVIELGSGQFGIDIVAFASRRKFSPLGSLADWQAAMRPFVLDQPLPFFVCAVALCGPLLKFLPPEVVSPQIELVGAAKTGKSTLGTLAASVWCGDPEKTEGGGESWNLTPSAYEILRQEHRDMLIVLDEAEGSGTDGQGRSALANALIFAGATTSSRRRYTDVGEAPYLRLPVLSTSNTPLWQVLRDRSPEAKQAALSRMFSLRVARTKSEGGLRAFPTKPAGFDSRANAVRGLRTAVNHAFGSAGPAFVTALVGLLAADRVAFTQRVTRDFLQIRQRLRSIDSDHDDRHLDMLAAIELSATLAQQVDVLPKDWGEPHRVIEMMLGAIMSPKTEQRRDLNAAWRSFRSQLAALTEKGVIPRPRLLPAFNAKENKTVSTSCSLDLRRRDILFEPSFFRQCFPNGTAILKAARLLGHLQTHPSEPERYTIRAPLARDGLAGMRVYSFDITSHFP